MASEMDLLQVISGSPIFTPDPPEGVERPRMTNAVEAMKAKVDRFDLLDRRIKYLDKHPLSKANVVRFEIARGLHLINSEKLYPLAGYNSISEYGNATLGFSTVVTSSYVRVAKRFISRNWPQSIFARIDNPDPNIGLEDFTLYQLIELSRLKDEEIKELMDDGRLTFDTSVPKIKALIKEYKAEKAEKEKKAVEASYQTMDAAHEDFHKAYNELKQHLLDVGDLDAANVLLPRIMDQVVIIYREGRDR